MDSSKKVFGNIVLRSFADIKQNTQTRQISNLIPPKSLPCLTGATADVTSAEKIRWNVLLYMAFRRKDFLRESRILACLLSHTDASWWLNAYRTFGSTVGVCRVLEFESMKEDTAPLPLSDDANSRDTECVSESPPCDIMNLVDSTDTIVYLVDGENICYKHLDSLRIFSDRHAKVIFCISNLSYSKESVLQFFPYVSSQIRFFVCEHKGKNALDFQLSALAGQILAVRKLPLRIVSRDTGYNVNVLMFCNQGYDVQRIAPENKPCKKKNETIMKSDPKTLIMKKADESLVWKGYRVGERDKVAEILVDYAVGKYKGQKFARSFCSAMGHIMKNGNRHTEIYAADKAGINSVLSFAKSLSV